MEEQSLESLAGSSNVELVMEPSAATATCTSGRWVFLAKGTALEVYDASGLTELVPLSPSKGISHFPFIVELLVNLRDGFSVLAMGSDGGRHWGIVSVAQTGIGCFNFSIFVGTADRPLLDPLPPSYASPLPFPFLNSIAVSRSRGVQRLESKVLLAGCLVNGILSSIAIAIDIMSVSTAPTLSTSIGMMQNKVKNNSSDSSEYKLQFHLPQQLVRVRWVSHTNLLGKIPLQEKKSTARDSNWNPNSTSPNNTSAWILNCDDELPVAMSCHISASCWISDGLLAVQMSCPDTPYSTVWPTHIRTYFVDDRSDGLIQKGPWRADFVHPQTTIASSSGIDWGSEDNDTSWNDALLLAVSPREITIYGMSGCLCTIPWEGHVSPIALTYSVSSSSFIIYTSSGHFHGCTYNNKRTAEETQHKYGTLKLTTNILKTDEFESQPVDISSTEPVWLLSVTPSEGTTVIGSSVESKMNNQCCSPAGVCNDGTLNGRTKRSALKEGAHCSNASNYWLLVGGRRRLCTAFSLCKCSNSPKMWIRTQVPQSLIPAMYAKRIDRAKDSGLKLLIAGNDHLSLACRGVMMSILAQGDTGLDGANLRLLSTTVMGRDIGCYDLLAFVDGSRGVTHFMSVTNEMVKPIELESEGTTTPQESSSSSFIHSESTIHLSCTGEWTLQVTQQQVVSVHQQTYLNDDGVQAGQSPLSTLHWERKRPTAYYLLPNWLHILSKNPESRANGNLPFLLLRGGGYRLTMLHPQTTQFGMLMKPADIFVLMVGKQGRLNCNACQRLDGAVAALTSTWSLTGRSGHTTSPNHYVNNKLLIAYSLWDTNMVQLLKMDSNDPNGWDLKQVTTLRRHDQIRSLQFCSLCLVAGMVDGQVCIYRLNECLSEPGHNPTPWKQKEVGSGPIFLHRIEAWKGLTARSSSSIPRDTVLIDGIMDGKLILEVWEEEVNQCEEALLQLSIVPVICNSRSNTKSHTNLSVLSCGEAFAWAERYHPHHRTDTSDSVLFNENANTYFTVFDGDAELGCSQNNGSDYFEWSSYWRLYIGTLTLNDDMMRVKDVPHVESTGSLMLTMPSNCQQHYHVTRRAKLKKCRASVERILLVPTCQCIVVAMRDTCGWYIVTYDDTFLSQTSYSPTTVEGEITSLLLTELPPAMSKAIGDHNREAKQIADSTALISVILLSKTRDEKRSREVMISCENRTTQTERPGNDLQTDESSVVLVLQGHLFIRVLPYHCLGKDVTVRVYSMAACNSSLVIYSATKPKVGWKSPSESGRLRWRFEEIYSTNGESSHNKGCDEEFDMLPQGCVTALASTKQKGKKGGFLAAAFLLNGVTLYGHDAESPKLFALMTWKDSTIPITCLGISWVLDSISIAVSQDSGIFICSAACIGACAGAQSKDEGDLELDYCSYHRDASQTQSFLPQLSGPLFTVAHLEFPTGFVPSCLFLSTTEKGGCLSSHNILTVCAASGAVYEAIHNISL